MSRSVLVGFVRIFKRLHRTSRNILGDIKGITGKFQESYSGLSSIYGCFNGTHTFHKAHGAFRIFPEVPDGFETNSKGLQGVSVAFCEFHGV